MNERNIIGCFTPSVLSSFIKGWQDAVINAKIIIKTFKLINYEKTNDFIHLNDECIMC